MKKLYTIFFLSFAAVAFPQMIAKYDFNANFNDLSGNGYNGSASGTLYTTDRFGNASSAVAFSGAGDYISMGSMNLNSSNLTISMWVKRAAPDGQGHCLFGQSFNQVVDNSLNIMMTGLVNVGEEDVGFDIYGDGVYDSTGATSLDWNHWTFTYDYGSLDTRIYRNGQLIKQATLMGSYAGSGVVYIGTTGWVSDFFAGNIDDVRIWGQLLSATQVDSVFQAEKPACASLALSASPANATCFGTATGSATVTPGSGVTPFTYAWSNGQTANTATGLAAGNYTCVVTDNMGCKDSVSVLIVEPSQIITVLSSTNTTCYGGNDGAADVQVSGGVTPYTYSWWPNNATTSSVNNLNPGTYYCTTYDNNGCSTLDTALIGQPAAFNGNITVSSPTVCIGEPDTLTANVTGGQAPYWYEWHDFGSGNIDTTYVDSLVLMPVGTGSTVIGVYIYDALGCSAYASAFFWANPGDSLSGRVMEPNLNPVTSGKVYLFQQKSNHVGVADTLIQFFLGTGGTFIQKTLPWGDYYLKAVADTLAYPNSIGTYYSNKSYPFQWDSALVIHHRTCSGLNDSAKNITIIEITPQTGPGDISGFVYTVPGFGSRLGNGGFAPQGAPLKGVDVKLGRNPGGSPAARTTTGNGGDYHFYNVPLGSYKIYVDIPNYGMDSARSVNLTPADSTSNNNNYYVDSAMVHVVPYYNIQVTAALCSGDSLLAGGFYQHASGVYYDSLVTALGGDSVIITSLTVNPLPAVTAHADNDTICTGTNVTLTGGGASTYTWSAGVTDGVAFSPSATDIYTVTGTDGNGCQDSATVRVVVQTCTTGGISHFATGNELKAFPNPAASTINISSAGIPLSIILQNAAGQIVMDVAVAGSSTQIDISKLQPGIYFAKVRLSKEVTKYLKIVKE